MNDIEGKASAMESQNWFQRMAKTIAGKNKLTLAEIRQNHEKMNVYLSEAIAELYNRNCIDHNVMMSLGVQINELYADHTQLKQMLGAFVGKLNEKIDSVDNFHMLVTEIDHGVYSQVPPIVAVCQVMSQFDNRILEDNRKLDIISRSLYAQNILSGNQIKLTEYLASILVLPMEDVGQIHLELGTIRDNFMASVILGVMESYYFLPDLARKMKDKRVLIKEIIQAGRLDASVSLSMDEIYDAFLDSKINVKNGLVSVRRESPINEDVTTSDIRDYAEITELGRASYVNEEDYSQAVKYFSIAAEGGYAEAQYWLGHCYYYGDGVAENKTEGFKWYMKGAQQDFAPAQCSVGCSYMNGEGIAPNTQEAFKWFMKAAEQGGPEAQYFVGNCYYYGDGVAENKKEAFKWYMKAAEQGDPDAQYMVGLLYSKGGAVMLDRTEAFKWFMKAAEQGNANAQLEVGKCYHGGSGTSQNYQKAEEWLRRSASQGNEEARQKMGQWYHQYVF
ncbi:MAG: sel1 repeat family protein [Lachnospiraceae bacterium]|nr:sel1 repeat family protein [Lachnospiraceae bacterium]